MRPLKAYACNNTNKEVRMNSSSGAVFSSLADFVLSKNGTVYGVAMTEDCYYAEFISVTDSKELYKLRGSKYLQARVGDTYKKVKEDLLSEKTVLFTGTGCQINGLKNFLGKEYDNLICVDVICHGVPSPALWREYAKYQEKKNDGKLKIVNFRCKDDSWTDFGINMAIENFPKHMMVKKFIFMRDDTYMQMFLRDYCLRPSCYECVAKDVKMSDLTIADFWGIEQVAPEMNDNMGTSLVLVRTKKGQTVFKKIRESMKSKEVAYEDGIKCNPAEYRSSRRPSQRDTFFVDMGHMTFEELEKKYMMSIEVPLKQKIKWKIKRVIKIFSKIGGGVKHSNADYGLFFVFERN